MKRIQIGLILAAVTTVAACGGAQHVTRAETAPMSFVPFAPAEDDGRTSDRAAIDLLSLS